MKVVFTGIAYFGKKLVEDLRIQEPQHHYVFCDTYASGWEKLKFMLHVFSADVVVSFNGVTTKSGSLDWVLRLKKKLVIQWHGSDVLTASENFRNNKTYRKYIDYGSSFTDAPWLQEELKRINIETHLLHFKSVQIEENGEPFPSKNVVTYFLQDKENFYGADKLKLLAEQFQEINFNVVGSDGKGCQMPSNVVFHGWVSSEKVKELLDLCPVYLRMCKHDGYALSVLDALANGNYVIYNHQMPSVFFAEDDNTLREQFGLVQKKITLNRGARNTDAFEWLQQQHSRSVVLKNYINQLFNSDKRMIK